MILTASDVSSIPRWLTFWEYAEYVSEAAVGLGCIGEYIAEYATWARKRWTEAELHEIGRRSLFVLILGLGLSLISLFEANSLSGRVIGSLGDEIVTVGQKAQLASTASELAANHAVTAEGRAAEAQADASAARESAKKAKEEADSYEREITLAKRRAAEATGGVARLKTNLSDRDLTEVQQESLSDKLRLTGIQYVDLFTFGNTNEIVSFSKLIRDVLICGRKDCLPTPEHRGWVVRWTSVEDNVYRGDILVTTVSGADAATNNGASILVSELHAASIKARRDSSSFPPHSFPQILSMRWAEPQGWPSAQTATIRIKIGTKP